MKRQLIDKYDGPTVPGIDVSHHQGEVDWPAVEASDVARFVIIRTGDGVSRDRHFIANWRAAKNTSLVIGAYHYFRAAHGWRKNADAMLSAIEAAGGRDGDELPLCIDYEGGATWTGVEGKTVDTEHSIIELLALLEHISDQIGRPAMLYGGQAIHWHLSQAHPDLVPAFAPYPLWVASYRSGAPAMPVGPEGDPAPWSEWAFWQHTSKGRVPGIAGDVDLNHYRGTLAELQALARRVPAAPLLPHEASACIPQDPSSPSELRAIASSLRHKADRLDAAAWSLEGR